MSGDNPNLILSDRKTQTRRIITRPEFDVIPGKSVTVGPVFRVKNGKIGGGLTANDFSFCYCPYGVAGDLPYVRETHWRYGRWVKNGKTETGGQRWKFLCHRSSSISFVKPNPLTNEKRINPKRGSGEGWYKRPSIFMPKSVARIWLEILKVRVERVQDISEEDAIAEGYWGSFATWEKTATKLPTGGWSSGFGNTLQDPRDWYRHLWDSLHGKGSWESNPWVWVLEFKRI